VPAWTNDPRVPIPLLTPGIWGYSAGSRPSGPNTRMLITANAIATDVATLYVTMIEGNIPAINDTLYVYATANSAGAFNTTTGVTITGVTIVAATGVGTITYALTASTQGKTNDTGYAISVIAEVPEVSTPSTAYQALALPHITPAQAPNSSISIYVTYPSAPASISWSLQVALNNVAAEFIDIISGETTAGTFSDSGAPGSASKQLWPGAWRFCRYIDAGSSGGTNPTVIARIMIG
jgi:hypothetical protein